MTDHGPITSARLRLELLSADAMRALRRGDVEEASRLQGRVLSPELVDTLEDRFLAVQLQRIEANPESRDWGARLMVLRDGGEVVGHGGFHGLPSAVGRAEIGYQVLPGHRRQGYATEAASALVAWAHAHGEATVFASVSPGNAASLAVVHAVGFRQTGTQLDDVDGEELVFEVDAGA